jgi:tryptophan-rich sensory protein
MKKLIGIFLSALACLVVGALGALVTQPGVSVWYVTLHKPELSPPNWLFAPVWSALFIMMGIAAALYWFRAGAEHKSRADLWIFGVQLFLNFSWSVLFFGLHSPALAALEIIALALAIGWNIIAFWKLSRLAALLLAPYLLWVLFAAYLNFSIVFLN